MLESVAQIAGSFSSFFFWPYQAAFGILVPRPRMEPVAPAVEAWSLNHWTSSEVPLSCFQPQKVSFQYFIIDCDTCTTLVVFPP